MFILPMVWRITSESSDSLQDTLNLATKEDSRPKSRRPCSCKRCRSTWHSCQAQVESSRVATTKPVSKGVMDAISPRVALLNGSKSWLPGRTG